MDNNTRLGGFWVSLLTLVGIVLIVFTLSINSFEQYIYQFDILDLFAISVGYFLLVVACFLGPFSERQKVVFILLMAFSLRIISFTCNQYLHSDMVMFSIVVENLAEGGSWLYPSEVIEQVVIGNKLITLGAIPTAALGVYLIPLIFSQFVSSAFMAFKLSSFFSGILILIFSYYISKKFFGPKTALYFLTLLAFSHTFVDYSANGSPHSLVIVFILAYLFFLVRNPTKKNSAALGLLVGVSFFFHYLLIIVFLSFPIFYLASQCVRKRFSDTITFLWGGFFIGLVASSLFTYLS
ncbi:MAG: glycosyltransferase family 39 protein, partial [Candidatus Altiarchaeota archaeon]